MSGPLPGAGRRKGVPGRRLPAVTRAMESNMAAFVGKPWGRYVYVGPYIHGRSGKMVKAHLRKWPGTKGDLYFWY
jgi:hypothetical protein